MNNKTDRYQDCDLPEPFQVNHKDAQGRDTCDIVKKQTRQRIARQQSEYEQQQQAIETDKHNATRTAIFAFLFVACVLAYTAWRMN